MKKPFKDKLDSNEHLLTQRWNQKDKDSKVGFYVTIAVVCFVIAWVMS